MVDVPKLSEGVAPATEPSRAMPIETCTDLAEESKPEKAAEKLKV
jgi:hypothetical protein